MLLRSRSSNLSRRRSTGESTNGRGIEGRLRLLVKNCFGDFWCYEITPLRAALSADAEAYIPFVEQLRHFSRLMEATLRVSGRDDVSSSERKLDPHQLLQAVGHVRDGERESCGRLNRFVAHSFMAVRSGRATIACARPLKISRQF